MPGLTGFENVSRDAFSILSGSIEAFCGRTGIAPDQAVRIAAARLSDSDLASGRQPADDGSRIVMWEVHHRVKNELQFIMSQMHRRRRMAASAADQAAWATCISQVASTAHLHELLVAAPSDSLVDLGEYLEVLCRNFALASGLEGRIVIEMELDSVNVPAAVAEPVSLIVNEAMTNAVKHGFGGARSGKIVVTLRAGAELGLTVADNGRGSPAGPAEGFGSRLMKALAERIGGHVSCFADAEGFVVECVVPRE